MKKLLKIHELNSDMQYYQMIANNFLNGQFADAYKFFSAMPRKNRVAFLKSATVGGWNSGIANNKIANLFDLM